MTTSERDLVFSSVTKPPRPDERTLRELYLRLGSVPAVATELGVAYETARRGWPGVTAIDLSDLFCAAALCYLVVGGLPVYYDRDHITGTF